jgi:hypothetical protein
MLTDVERMKHRTIRWGAQGLVLAQGASAINNRAANFQAAQFQRATGNSDPVSIVVVLG